MINVDEYGSFTLSFHPADFRELGIQIGRQVFKIKLKDQEVSAMFDAYPFISARRSNATYLVYEDAEGFMTCEKNALETSASPEITLLRLEKGDTAYIDAPTLPKPGRLNVSNFNLFSNK